LTIKRIRETLKAWWTQKPSRPETVMIISGQRVTNEQLDKDMRSWYPRQRLQQRFR